jgi:hypothetical protein
MAPCPLPINCLMLKIAEPEWPPALPCPLPQSDESEPLPIWWPACIAMSNPNLDPNPTTYDQGASRSGMSLERRDEPGSTFKAFTVNKIRRGVLLDSHLSTESECVPCIDFLLRSP